MRSRKVTLHAALLSLALLAGPPHPPSCASLTYWSRERRASSIGHFQIKLATHASSESQGTLKHGFMPESSKTATPSIPRQSCVSPFGIAPPPAFFGGLCVAIYASPILALPSHKTPCRPHSLSFLSIRLQTYQSTSTKPNNNPIPQI